MRLWQRIKSYHAQCFNLNRYVTESEESSRLFVKQCMDAKPSNLLGLIKFNSTYIECVDKTYLWKGVRSSAFLLMATLVLAGTFIMAEGIVSTWHERESNMGAGSALAVMLLIASGLLAVVAMGLCIVRTV